MDNICHTLVGAALGEAGLKRRSRLAGPALLLGANLPDVDVLSYFRGPVFALSFRRGWTHGPFGLLVLSLVLTALLIGVDRVAARFARRPLPESSAPVPVLPLFAVTLVAALTHPILDFLNTYGVRWLLPLDRSWYYGDTLFIVDPWVWAILILGLAWSGVRARRQAKRTEAPAIAALCVTVLYVVAMGAATVAARGEVARALRGANTPFTRLMVAPVAANPFRRDLLLEDATSYRAGSFSWLDAPRLRWNRAAVAKNDADALAAAAAAAPDSRRFLTWSRFPYYVIDRARGDVQIMDARYNAEWASVTVKVRSEK
ncbi:MAG: metal-dependent hydrolase [Gemmatimonadetes bacterium]|nr:metal-dependent hydrolase [Gemmatimonadota bacterium]